MKGSEYGYVEKKDVSGFKVFIKFPKNPEIDEEKFQAGDKENSFQGIERISWQGRQIDEKSKNVVAGELQSTVGCRWRFGYTEADRVRLCTDTPRLESG